MAQLPVPPGRPAGLAVPLTRTAGIVLPAAAAMAVGMGVGRFVYMPILPLMTARAAHWCCGTASRTTSDPYPAGCGPPSDPRR